MESVQPEQKAAILSGMSGFLCGVKKQKENQSESNPSQSKNNWNEPASDPVNPKLPLPRLRAPLQTVSMNVMEIPLKDETALESTSSVTDDQDFSNDFTNIEMSLAKAISASIITELTPDIDFVKHEMDEDSDNEEENKKFLPPLSVFLEDI